MARLSEQSRIAYLQERIKDAKNNSRLYFVVSMVGVFVLTWGFGGHDSELILIGLLLIGISAPLDFYYYRQKEKLLEELRHLPNIKCSNCGKELSEKVPYCPFCGKPLET